MADITVLIVDDDRTIVRLCQRLLERASYHVITAMDPLDALKILERQKVDLLLTDIRMPIMDGFELISQVKESQPELPVLVMTGYGSIDTAIQALHRGVDGLILKPFENTAELVQAVQNVLEESRQRRDAARLQAFRPLFDVSERLLAETSPQTLEKLILNAITGLFQASHAGIHRFDAQRKTLETIRVTPNSHLTMVPTLRQYLMECISKDGPAVALNVSGPSSTEVARQLLQGTDLEGMLVVPVQRNAIQFVFCACRKTGGIPFAEADLEMLVILAHQAAVAMENARLYSELKDYVRRIEESQRALIQAEKMAAVGRLMASLAHEINNPLQAVRNCLHLAMRKGIEAENRERYLAMTNNELDRLVTTVSHMLDFYRPGGFENEKVDILQMIERVMALLAPQLEDLSIAVHLNTHGQHTLVEMVADQIQQVIFNLLLNSIDALSEVPSGEAKEIWMNVHFEECQVRLVIEDSGPGIPPDLSKRIFEPFMSTKEQGTGLGLAVSYAIMERHYGSLALISPGYCNGACFEMILPVAFEGKNGEDTDR